MFEIPKSWNIILCKSLQAQGSRVFHCRSLFIQSPAVALTWEISQGISQILPYIGLISPVIQISGQQKSLTTLFIHARSQHTLSQHKACAISRSIPTRVSLYSKQEILNVLGDEDGLDDFVAQLKDKNKQLLSANG